MVFIVCIWSRKYLKKEHHGWGVKKLKPTSNWEKDLDQNMIMVGVIEDSEGSCQHAVTIFCKWVFDSNKNVALPLCQESLDCCTWEVKDGKVTRYSRFVKFIAGWIFYENDTKKDSN